MNWAKMRWAIFLSTALLLFGGGFELAQPPGLVVDPLHRTMTLEGGEAIIDWREGYIQVTAIGTADPAMVVNRSHERILATKTARLRAYEKLGEILNGVTVDSQGILGEELLRSSTLASSMTATIRNAQIIEERSEINPEDGSIMGFVTVAVLTRNLNRPIVEHILTTRPPPVPEKVYVLPAPVVRETPPTDPVETAPTGPVPTGLIVDASGLGGDASIAISLLTHPDRKVVYGPNLLDREVAFNIGRAQYHGSVEAAQAEIELLGDNPMVVRAVSVEGKNRADYLISKEDAQRVKLADLDGGFLRQCKVAVILR